MVEGDPYILVADVGVPAVLFGLVPDAHEARLYLDDIRRLNVAVYEVEYLPRDFTIETPARLERLLEKDDWEIAVKEREHDQSLWILYRT